MNQNDIQKASIEVTNFVQNLKNEVNKKYKPFMTSFIFLPIFLKSIKKLELRPYFKQPLRVNSIAFFFLTLFVSLIFLAGAIALTVTSEMTHALVFMWVWVGILLFAFLFGLPYIVLNTFAYKWIWNIYSKGWTDSLFHKRNKENDEK